MPAPSQSKWYYRLEDKVYGPANMHELLQFLVDGNITITTEVSQDNSQFKLLCDEPSIEEFIKGILGQKRIASPAEGSSPSGKRNTGIEFDVASMAASIDSQLQEAEFLSKVNFESASLRKILVDIQVEKGPGPIVVPDSVHKQGRHLEYDISARRKKKSNRSWKSYINKIAVAITAALIGFVVFSFYRIQKERFYQEELRLQQEFVKLALQAKALGEFKKSLEEFKRAG